jgi:hypothetical protein
VCRQAGWECWSVGMDRKPIELEEGWSKMEVSGRATRVQELSESSDSCTHALEALPGCEAMVTLVLLVSTC